MKYIFFICLFLNVLHITAGQNPNHLRRIRPPQPAPDKTTISDKNSVNQIQAPSNKR